MSFMEQKRLLYMSSPLANSTKICTVCKDCTNMAYAHLYGNEASTDKSVPLTPRNITSANILNAPSVNNTDITSRTVSFACSNKETSTETLSSQNSVCRKKPKVARKSITARKSVEPIKAVATNCKSQALTVENILKEINMTKYYHSFKKLDVEKFMELKEIDLNAFGITRPSEIRIFKEAIRKAKLKVFNF